MNAVVVGMADCAILTDPARMVATFALGSCIGLAVYDPEIRAGGLLHFMLPDSSIDKEGSARNPYKFADTGVPKLLSEMAALGAERRRLAAWAAGAASVLEPAAGFEIGKRNYQAVRRLLWKSGLLLQGEAVGGNQSRSIALEIATGNCWVQETGASRTLLAPGRNRGNPWAIAS